MFIRNDLEIRLLSKVEKEHTILVVEIETKHVRQVAIGVYNPPRQNTPLFLSNLEEVLTAYSTQPLLIEGDVNVDVLKSEGITVQYEMLCTSLGLVLDNTCHPTRVHDQKRSN